MKNVKRMMSALVLAAAGLTMSIPVASAQAAENTAAEVYVCHYIGGGWWHCHQL